MWGGKKKQEPESPQVEPGLQSKADGIQFSNEPSFGNPIPISEVDLPSDSKIPKSGMVSVESPTPYPIDNPTDKVQPAAVTQETSMAEPKPSSFGLFKSKEEANNLSPEEIRKNKWIKARRRFVGALVLFLAAVIILPLVFDEEPPPKAVTIPLRIPNENSIDVAKITVPGNADQVSSRQQPPQKTEVKPVVVQPAKQPNETSAKGDSKGETKPSDKAGSKGEVSKDTKKDNKAGTKPDPKKEETAKTKPEAKKADQQKNTGDSYAVPPMAKGSFYIQVIALSNETRAKEIANKLKSAGVNSFLAPISVQSGKVYRVQCGPYKNREEANSANAKISLAGMVAGKVLQVR